MSIKYVDEVILVTGASRGLGAAFAKHLAANGATVIVNSTGTNSKGQTVVDEIKQAGGNAINLVGSVTDAQSLIQQVIEQAGRIDGLVHNAGFVRDKTLRKMTDVMWDEVLDVHLKAAFHLTQAAWSHFEQQSYGRVVFISSSAGLYGNFGQANYAAAKMGLFGLCQTIELEGNAHNIGCNVVAPFGATELNSANLSEQMKDAARAEYVAPIVSYLAHPSCKTTGGLFEASSGVFKQVRWQRSAGLRLQPNQTLSLQDIADNWHEVTNFDSVEYPTEMRTGLQAMYDPDFKLHP